jgi:hypothetical protein
MALLSDLPPELVIKIMVKSAIHSRNFRSAYALATTSKKHYACFKNQERHIFSLIVQGLIQPRYVGRYNITLKFGDLTVVSNYPDPNDCDRDPASLELTFKDDRSNRPLSSGLAPIISWIRRNDIHQTVALGYWEPNPGFQKIVCGNHWSLAIKVGDNPPWKTPEIEEGLDIPGDT